MGLAGLCGTLTPRPPVGNVTLVVAVSSFMTGATVADGGGVPVPAGTAGEVTGAVLTGIWLMGVSFGVAAGTSASVVD